MRHRHSGLHPTVDHQLPRPAHSGPPETKKAQSLFSLSCLRLEEVQDRFLKLGAHGSAAFSERDSVQFSIVLRKMKTALKIYDGGIFFGSHILPSCRLQSLAGYLCIHL